MPKLIFDIETIGAMDFEKLDEKSQELLLDSCETDEERELVREGMGLSPLTGRIAAIAILNPETNKARFTIRNKIKKLKKRLMETLSSPAPMKKRF